MLFSGEVCGERPGGAFLYTNQETLSLGVVCPLASLAQSDIPAAELLERLKTPSGAVSAAQRQRNAGIWRTSGT
ncbi:FAD-dependent oxidoreductase [Citrobacter freundii]|nr:FAD-dependent oxidoreductase [Citrobacter freundii]